MTDMLLQAFREVKKCACGCGGLKFSTTERNQVYISPYGADPGDNPEKFFRMTELMHPLVIDELWNIKEAFLE